MTGFARAEGKEGTLSWAWEARSVNGKSLDIRCRLPTGFDRLEVPVRKAAAERLARGNVSLTLSIDRAATQGGYRINRDLLDQVLALRQELGDVVASAPPTLEGILAVRGIVEAVEATDDTADTERRDAAILGTLDEALAGLTVMRGEEGAHLKQIADGLLDQIEALLDTARAGAAAQPEAVAQRVKDMVGELTEAGPNISEDRLTQEIALVIGRADVREELDRLTAHLAAARNLVSGVGPIGRKFDFLCQEFNREANTLCAKAADMALNATGLELKAAVEQLREQIQNIE